MWCEYPVARSDPTTSETQRISVSARARGPRARRVGPQRVHPLPALALEPVAAPDVLAPADDLADEALDRLDRRVAVAVGALSGLDASIGSSRPRLSAGESIECHMNGSRRPSRPATARSRRGGSRRTDAAPGGPRRGAPAQSRGPSSPNVLEAELVEVAAHLRVDLVLAGAVGPRRQPSAGGGRRFSASKFQRPPAGSSPSMSTSRRRRWWR